MAGIESLSYQSFAATIGTYNRGQVAFDAQTQGLKLVSHHKFSSRTTEMTAENLAVRERFAEVVRQKLGSLATDSFMAQIRSQLGLGAGVVAAEALDRTTIHDILAQVNAKTSLLNAHAEDQGSDANTLIRYLKDSVRRVTLISAKFDTPEAWAVCTGSSAEELAFPSEAIQKQAKAAIQAQLAQARALGLQGLPSSLSTHQLDNIVKGNLPRFMDGVARHLLDIHNAGFNLCSNHLNISAVRLVGVQGEAQRYPFPTVAVAMALREMLATIPGGELAAVARNEQDLQNAAVAYTTTFRAAQMASAPRTTSDVGLTAEEFKRDFPLRCKQFAALAQADLAAFGQPDDRTLAQAAERYFAAPVADPAKHAQLSEGIAKLTTLTGALYTLQQFHDRAFHEGQDDALIADLAQTAARIDALLGDEGSVAAMRRAAKTLCPETILAQAFKALASRERCSGHFFADCAEAMARLHLPEEAPRTPSVTLGEVPEARMTVAHVSSEEAQLMLKRLPPQEAQAMGLLLGDLPPSEEMRHPRSTLAQDLATARDVLRGFPEPGADNVPMRGDVVEGSAFSRTVTLQGVTIALSQQHNGILTASVKGLSVPLHLSAGNLADAFERILCAHAAAPENFARVQQFIAEIARDTPVSKLPAGPSAQLRALATGTIAAYAGVPVSQLDAISTEDLVETVRTWDPAAPGHTPEVMQQMFAPRRVSQHQLPVNNGLSILEMIEALHQTSAEALEAKVGYHQVPEAPALNTQHNLAFTPEQYRLKTFIADLLFEKDTWVADANTSPEQRAALLRQVLLKHVGVIAKAIASPLAFDRLLKSLPFPGNEQARTLINGRISMLTMGLAAITAQFKSGATEQMIEETLVQLFKGQAPQLAPEAQAKLEAYEAKQTEAKQAGGWLSFFSRVTDALAGADEEAPADVRQAQVQRSVNEVLAAKLDDDFFNALDDNLNAAVNGMMAGMQEAMLDAVAAIFGAEAGDQDPLPALSGENLETVPDRPAEMPEVVRPESDLDTLLAEGLRGRRGQGAFIRKVLCHYFAEINDNDKRAMIASALRDLRPMPPIPAGLSGEALDRANEERMGNFLSGLLKGAGPLLQKMLQGLPEEGVPEGLRGALRDMKSNLAPIPETIIKAQLLAMVERSNGQITRIELVKSLGAASVGQALLCRLYTPDNPEGQPVVVKLLRPDVTGRMAREKELMQRAALAVGPGMLATYNGQLARVLEELDLNLEATNTKRGSLYNELLKGTTQTQVSSMRLCPLVPPSTTAMVAEVAPGTTLDEFLEDSRTLTRTTEETLHSQAVQTARANPQLGTFTDYSTQNTYALRKDFANIATTLTRRHRAAMQHHDNLLDLAGKWVEQGVFKGGYYHGDLHAGNIMVSSGSGAQNARLTVIDFGNATSLTKEQQTLISQMTVAAAAGAGYAKTFRHAFHQLLNPKYEPLYQHVREAYLRDIEAIFAKGGPSQSGQRIAVALLRAQDYGLELPSAVFNFSQSQIRLQNAVKDSNTGKKQLLTALNKMLNIGRGGNATLDPVAHLMGNQNLASPDIDENRRSTLIKQARARIDAFSSSLFYSADSLRQRLTASKDFNTNRTVAHDFMTDLGNRFDCTAMTFLTAVAPRGRDPAAALSDLFSSNAEPWAGVYAPELKQHVATFGPALSMDIAATNRAIDAFTAALTAARQTQTPENTAALSAALANLQQAIDPLFTLDALQQRCSAAKAPLISFVKSHVFTPEEVQRGIEGVLAAYEEVRAFFNGQPFTQEARTYIDRAFNAIVEAERAGTSAEVDRTLQSYYDDRDHGGTELRRAVDEVRAALRTGLDPAADAIAEHKRAFARAYQSVVAEGLRQISGGLEAIEIVNFSDDYRDFLNVMDDVVGGYSADAIKSLGAVKGYFMGRAIRNARAAEAQDHANA